MTSDVSSSEYQRSYGQFILFGDSLTELSCDQEIGFGLHAQLQHVYSRRLDVINRGFWYAENITVQSKSDSSCSGYTSGNAVQALPIFFPSLATADVQLMTVFLGCNDACVPSMYQHVPLDVYKSNLQRIIQDPSIKVQSPKIIIVTPPPVNQYQLEAFDASEGNPHPSRTAFNTRCYAIAAREVANESGLPVADAWTAIATACGWKEGEALPGSRDVPENATLKGLLTDGLHLTSSGYRILFEAVMTTIRTQYPEYAPENLPMVLPDWRVAPR